MKNTIDEDTKWKTRILRQIQAAGPVGMVELGAPLFEIAQSLFALEQTFILGAMVLNKNTNSERFAHERYKEKRAQ